MDVPSVPSTAFGRAAVWVSTFLKAHEYLLIAILAAVVLLGVTGKVQDAIAAHDGRVAVAAEIARKAQADANVALAQQAVQAAADYKQVTQQVLTEYRALEAKNAALEAQLKKQQDADAKLPPPELAARIETLAGIPAGNVTPTPGESFNVTQTGAVAIAQTLEKVPVLTDQLANAKAEKAGADKQLASQANVVTSLGAQVTGLKTEQTLADAACKADIKSVKADAAKGKRKWFVAGYVSGFASAIAIKLFGGK